MFNGNAKESQTDQCIHILLTILLVSMMKHLFLNFVNETHFRCLE
jgi:hypothetical protein